MFAQPAILIPVIYLATKPSLSPPPAPPPPASPGASYGYRVRQVFTVSGDLSTFDSAAVKSALLTEYPTAVDVAIVATSGSVNVDAQLIFSDEAAATTVQSDLSSQSMSTLGTMLGLTVVSMEPTEAVQAARFPAPSPPSPPSPPPPYNGVSGHWASSFGETFTITNTKWQSVASWGTNDYTIDSFGDNYIIMQNPSNAYYPGKWTKVEFHALTDGGFSYCMSIYDAETAAAALAADTSTIYDSSDASAGCGGFGHTDVTAYHNPIDGTWADTYGTTITITNDLWHSTASWGITTYTIESFGPNFVIMQNPPNAYNPNKWTKVEFHALTAGGFSYCMSKYDAETASAALAFDSSATYNTSDASAGCGGFGHSAVVPVPLAIAGNWTSNWGAAMTITNLEWRSVSSYGTSVYKIDSWGNNFAIMQNAPDAYYPNKWTKVEWHALTGSGFSFCMSVYDKDTAAHALVSDTAALYNTSDAAAGCSGFGHTVATLAR